jgi:hypothetical protein
MGSRFVLQLAQKSYTLCHIVNMHKQGRRHPVLLRFIGERQGTARPHCLDFLYCVNTPENVRAAWKHPRGPRAPRTSMNPSVLNHLTLRVLRS